MTSRTQLRERVRKVDALRRGAVTDGEREAAEAALARLKAKLDDPRHPDPPERSGSACRASCRVPGLCRSSCRCSQSRWRPGSRSCGPAPRGAPEAKQAPGAGPSPKANARRRRPRANNRNGAMPTLARRRPSSTTRATRTSLERSGSACRASCRMRASASAPRGEQAREAPGRSIFPHQRNQPALNGARDPVRRCGSRSRIRGLERDRGAALAQALQRGLLVVDQGDNDVAGIPPSPAA